MRSAVLAAVVLLLGLVPVPAADAAQGCGPAAVSVADRTLYEGTPDLNPGYTTFSFTVSVASAAGCAPTGTVSYKTEDGSPGATSPADYVPVNGRLTWTGEASSRTVSVQVVKDAVPEPNEPFLLRLYDPVGVTLADDLAAGGVLDDDGSRRAARGRVDRRREDLLEGLRDRRARQHPGAGAGDRALPHPAGRRRRPGVRAGEGRDPHHPGRRERGDAVVKLLDTQSESRFVLELFSPSRPARSATRGRR